MNRSRPVFHLAIPVHDLKEARVFYGGTLGLTEGRSAESWVDWNLYGHQVVTHVVAGVSLAPTGHTFVDGHEVPVPHFGLILPIDDFHELADRMRASGTSFIIEPYVRFQSQPGEQWTMFFRDPAGNALEFKSFQHESAIFAK
jgi:extradiol dioxygenase family protein